MKSKIGGVGRSFLLLVVALTGFAGSVRADDNAPPVGGSVAPGTPVELPIHVLRPSPAGRMGAMAVTATGSLDVIVEPILDMKVLVILDSVIQVGGVDYPDGVNQMVTGYLDILGIPYDVVDVNGRTPEAPAPITEAMLWDGENHGAYYAIFVGNNTVWWPAGSEGLTEAEREIVRRYERAFDVRRVTWYVYPEASQYGLDFVSGTDAVLTVTMTAAGKQIFGYLNPDLALALTAGYTFLGDPASGATVTPLVVDGAGHPIVSIFESAGAGEHMVVTTSSYYPATPPVSLHARLWPYGIINWATKGVFLGERHLYFTPQPDDMLSFGDRWDLATHTTVYDEGFRLTAGDVENLVAWQSLFRSSVNAADFKIEMPFNGEGMLLDTAGNGAIQPGSLTAAAMTHQDQFVWLNHTYSHADLDPASTGLAHSEIVSNTEVAQALGLADYVTTTLLTGAYSGLNNFDMVSTAYALGIRYILANASQPGYNNPTPNTGLTPYAWPDLLLVPRLANNIFYFSNTPEQETDYYNTLYCPGYAADPDNVTPCYTYEELLDAITDQALGFLLDFNVDATMFHMNNLDQYDPLTDRTLLGDYAESLYGKYNALYNATVPVLSPRTQEIGQKMWERMDYNASGASGIIACTRAITLTTVNAATIPVTGVTYGSTTETYAGQSISSIDMTAGQTLSIPGSAVSASAASTPDAVTGLTLVANPDNTRSLSWNPVAGVYGYRIYRGNSAQTLVEIDVVADPFYLDPTIDGGTTYAVVAIADDCWKQESAPTLAQLRPTAVRLTSLGAGPYSVLSVASLLIVPFGGVLVGLVLVQGRRRQESRS